LSVCRCWLAWAVCGPGVSPMCPRGDPLLEDCSRSLGPRSADVHEGSTAA
jgi:hypothetical protein